MFKLIRQYLYSPDTLSWTFGPNSSLAWNQVEQEVLAKVMAWKSTSFPIPDFDTDWISIKVKGKHSHARAHTHIHTQWFMPLYRLLYGISYYNINCLQRTENGAGCTVQHIIYHDHVTPFLQILYWLSKCY